MLPFSVVVPTKNSAGHIDIVLDFYAAHAIPVTVFVDSASTDATFAICRARTETMLIDNPSGRLEGLVAGMSERAGTDWILRIDDDELPRPSVIAEASRVVGFDPGTCYSIPRCECVLGVDGRLLSLECYRTSAHEQTRLYNRRNVTFHDQIHTPAFEIREILRFQGGHFLIHFQNIVHSAARRAAKIADYDRQSPDAGSMFRSMILVENNAAALATACPLESAEFDETARRLSARFPDALRLPLPSTRRGRVASKRMVRQFRDAATHSQEDAR